MVVRILINRHSGVTSEVGSFHDRSRCEAEAEAEMVGNQDCGAAARDYSSILRVSYDRQLCKKRSYAQAPTRDEVTS